MLTFAGYTSFMTAPHPSEITLRPLARSDLEQIFRWHNSPQLYETLLGTYRQVTIDDVANWLETRLQQTETESNWAICLRATGEHLGNFYLRDVDRLTGRCELHLFLGDAASRGKGHGTAAVREGIRIAFEQLGLNQIVLRVLASNAPAIRVYEKCGFRIHEILPAASQKAGKSIDIYQMILVRQNVDEC